MLVRYFPSRWMALIRNEGGDGALPFLREAMDYIDQDFPRLVQISRLPRLIYDPLWRSEAPSSRPEPFRAKLRPYLRYPDQSKFRRFAGGSNARNALAGPLMCYGPEPVPRAGERYPMNLPRGYRLRMASQAESAELKKPLERFSRVWRLSRIRPANGQAFIAPSTSRQAAGARSSMRASSPSWACRRSAIMIFPRPLFRCIRRPSSLSRTRHRGVIPFASSPGPPPGPDREVGGGGGGRGGKGKGGGEGGERGGEGAKEEEGGEGKGRGGEGRLENPLCEINQPPAHHPVGGWIGAVLDLLGKGAPVLVVEQGRLAWCLAILEALRTLGIEAQHPITDRLQADATNARRIAARTAVKNLGKRQQTTGKGGILALLGEGTKLKSCKIRPKGNRHRHGESPLFAKMNHAAADLKTHNELAFQRRGIRRTKTTREGLAQIVRTGWYRAVHVKSFESHRARALLAQGLNSSV